VRTLAGSPARAACLAIFAGEEVTRPPATRRSIGGWWHLFTMRLSGGQIGIRAQDTPASARRA